MRWQYTAGHAESRDSDHHGVQRRLFTSLIAAFAAIVAGLLAWLLAPGDPILVAAAITLSILGLAASGHSSSRKHLLHLPFMARTMSLLVPLLVATVSGLATAAWIVDISSLSAVVAAVGSVLIGHAGGLLRNRLLHTKCKPIRVAVVGPARYASGLREELHFGPDSRFALAGRLDLVDRAENSLADIVRRERLDLLLTARSGPANELFEEIEATWGDLPVAVQDLSTFYELHLGRAPLAAVDPGWLQGLLEPKARIGEAVRRFIDLAVAVPTLLLLAPILAVLMLIVRRDGGPALYRQQRIGKGGQPFEILKLRSMRPSSLADSVWSASDDDRVTRVGRFLRASHLDEAPQLVNIVRGDMSLVGPRPEQTAIVERLSADIPYYGWRHRVRPGITGWAQVLAGYCGTDRGAAVKTCYDLYYLKYRSLPLDLLILFETVRTLVADRQWNLPDFDEAFIPVGSIEPGIEVEPADLPSAGSPVPVNADQPRATEADPDLVGARL